MFEFFSNLKHLGCPELKRLHMFSPVEVRVEPLLLMVGAVLFDTLESFDEMSVIAEAADVVALVLHARAHSIEGTSLQCNPHIVSVQ